MLIVQTAMKSSSVSCGRCGLYTSLIVFVCGYVIRTMIPPSFFHQRQCSDDEGKKYLEQVVCPTVCCYSKKYYSIISYTLKKDIMNFRQLEKLT